MRRPSGEMGFRHAPQVRDMAADRSGDKARRKRNASSSRQARQTKH